MMLTEDRLRQYQVAHAKRVAEIQKLKEELKNAKSEIASLQAELNKKSSPVASEPQKKATTTRRRRKKKPVDESKVVNTVKNENTVSTETDLDQNESDNN